MLITKIESQKKDINRINLFVDDEFYFGLHVDLLAEYSLYKGLEVTKDKLDEIFAAEIDRRLFDRAVGYLARAPKTEYLIKRYVRNLIFKKKGSWFSKELEIDSDELINKVIEKLHRFKYLNDRKYAELFVQSRIQNRPRANNILVMELVANGVEREMAKEVVEDLVTDQYEVLKRVFEKKYRDGKITFKDRKKIDFLARKGFSWDLISQLIKSYDARE